jgi:hypothetical protein
MYAAGIHLVPWDFCGVGSSRRRRRVCGVVADPFTSTTSIALLDHRENILYHFREFYFHKVSPKMCRKLDGKLGKIDVYLSQVPPKCTTPMRGVSRTEPMTNLLN